MIDQRLARRYARALLDVARGENAIEKYGDEIAVFSGLVEGHADLSKILFGGLFSIADRKALVKKFAEKTGASKAVTNFLLLLVDKDRMRYLPEIVAQYRESADDLAGRARARILSAAQLDEAYRKQLTEQLGKVVSRKVEAAYEVDPSVLGGVRAEIGSYVIDGTVRAQLARLTQKLQQN